MLPYYEKYGISCLLINSQLSSLSQTRAVSLRFKMPINVSIAKSYGLVGRHKCLHWYGRCDSWPSESRGWKLPSLNTAPLLKYVTYKYLKPPCLNSIFQVSHHSISGKCFTKLQTHMWMRRSCGGRLPVGDDENHNLPWEAITTSNENPKCGLWTSIVDDFAQLTAQQLRKCQLPASNYHHREEARFGYGLKINVPMGVE